MCRWQRSAFPCASRSFNRMVQDKQLTPALSMKLMVRLGRCQANAITHENAVPTSASCLMRPAMVYGCVQCSLQSEDECTLCCAECPLMYILRMLVKTIKSARVDCGYSPRQSSTSCSSSHLACIRDTVLYNRASLTNGLD
jgi:hypothetical protein